MCRKNCVCAASVIGFGGGLLAGLILDSAFVTLLVGLAAICAGMRLLRGKCRA